MTTRSFRFCILAAMCCLVIACGGSDSDSLAPGTEAKNTILMIGDGMGSEHRKAARWSSVNDTGMLAMDDMPVAGMLETASANNPITDSAAAATAMATGLKTRNGVIGMDENLVPLVTILEKAKLRGKSVGLVTTMQITHATPAAFAAHVQDRDMMIEIAEQILIAGVDVLLGGGESEFVPDSDRGCFPGRGNRTDGRNLIDEAVASGYVYVCTAAEFDLVDPAGNSKLLGLFEEGEMDRPFSPTLREMTQVAIEILGNNPEGFFLLVEGGQIDPASHGNDAVNAINDTIGFDSAVEAAKDFAALEGDTLLIVTADHETGGMSVSMTASGAADEDGPYPMPDGREFYVNWSTTSHTGVEVPVSALGPGSGMLSGVHDNTFIHDLILGSFGD